MALRVWVLVWVVRARLRVSMGISHMERMPEAIHSDWL